MTNTGKQLAPVIRVRSALTALRQQGQGCIRDGARRLVITTAGIALLAGCSVVPQPLTRAELDAIAADRSARLISADQEPISGSVDLYEAMARAIKYNLDHQVELKEEALRLAELDLSEYDMLPDLVANAEYTGRDNSPGSSSISLATGEQSLEPSRSSARDETSADLTLSWDVLDFGLSYVRSKQEADEVLIALEQRRAAINRVVEDVRTAYWRAVSAQRLERRIDAVRGEAERALARSQRQSQGGSQPLETLTYQRELLTTIRATEELRRDLRVAKVQLAALMNLPPDTHYHVVVPQRHRLSSPIVSAPLDDLFAHAFRNRPELREISYRERIQENERQAILLDTLPSIRGFLGLNTNNNDLLANQDWVSYGARASWNVLNAFRYPQRRRTAEAGEELLDARALALTLAVATQVAVSKARVESLSSETRTAARFQSVSAKIANRTAAQAGAGATGDRERIRENLNDILAQLRFDVAYADLQNAYANLYAAIGADAYAPGLTGREPVDQMAAALRDLWAQRGDRNARR